MTDPAEAADAEPAKVTEQDKQDVLAALPGSIPVPGLDPKARQAGQTHRLRGVYGWVLLGFLLSKSW